MDTKKVLKDLCMASGVNGVKEAGLCAKRYLEAYTKDIETDDMGNVIGHISCGKPNAKNILLEAHIDEIGFIVTGVDDKGFLRIAPCGGVDERVMAAAEVLVLTEPPLAGVVCSTPPHLAKDDEAIGTVEENGIDVGLTKEEASARVPLGTRIVFRPHFEELLSDRVCAKAIDDRGGVVSILKALDLIKDRERNIDLTVAFCTQEEIGERGATVAAYRAKADAAIAVDVTFAYAPGSDKDKCGELGKGVMIGHSPILDRALTKQAVLLAEKNHIPFQNEVMGERTGTDADQIGISRDGVRMMLFSIPQRYMHTPVEVVSIADIDSTAQLIAAVVTEGEV